MSTSSTTTTSTSKKPSTSTPYTVTSEDWAGVLLDAIKAPVNATNIANVQRIIAAESAGNKAGYLRDNNPFNLNTYSTPHTSLPGGTIVHEFGIYVQTFPTIAAGVTATANQISQSPALLKAFQNSAPASVVGGALSTSAWSSAGYANATTFPTLVPFTGSALASTKQIGGTPSGITTVGNPGDVIGNTGTIAGAAASDIPVLSSLEGLLSDVTNPAKLKNIGIFLLGAVLVGVGLAITFLDKEGPNIAKIGEVAA